MWCNAEYIKRLVVPIYKSFLIEKYYKHVKKITEEYKRNVND